MSIETATFVGDLQPINPPATDPRGQGDDHLRLIKTVLQNSFPSLEKAIYFDLTVAKSANFSVIAANMNTLFLVTTTSGAITATLPSGLLTADAGWSCRFMKVTTDTNPLFVAPATGTLTSGATSGLASARRCIPGTEFKAIWTGSAWIITRCVDVPVGSMIDFNSTGLPAGFEWPNGQTLTSVATAYPEYNAAVGSGVTPDLRGRVAVTLDNLGGSAAGRLAGGVITGTTIGSTGGVDTVTLSTAQIPSHTHSNTLTDPGHQHGRQAFNPASAGNTMAGTNGGSLGSSSLNNSATTGITITNAAIGGGTSHSNLQPSLMCSKILVVE